MADQIASIVLGVAKKLYAMHQEKEAALEDVKETSELVGRIIGILERFSDVSFPEGDSRRQPLIKLKDILEKLTKEVESFSNMGKAQKFIKASMFRVSIKTITKKIQNDYIPQLMLALQVESAARGQEAEQDLLSDLHPKTRQFWSTNFDKEPCVPWKKFRPFLTKYLEKTLSTLPEKERVTLSSNEFTLLQRTLVDEENDVTVMALEAFTNKQELAESVKNFLQDYHEDDDENQAELNTELKRFADEQNRIVAQKMEELKAQEKGLHEKAKKEGKKAAEEELKKLMLEKAELEAEEKFKTDLLKSVDTKSVFDQIGFLCRKRKDILKDFPILPPTEKVHVRATCCYPSPIPTDGGNFYVTDNYICFRHPLAAISLGQSPVFSFVLKIEHVVRISKPTSLWPLSTIDVFVDQEAGGYPSDKISFYLFSPDPPRDNIIRKIKILRGLEQASAREVPKLEGQVRWGLRTWWLKQFSSSLELYESSQSVEAEEHLPLSSILCCSLDESTHNSFVIVTKDEDYDLSVPMDGAVSRENWVEAIRSQLGIPLFPFEYFEVCKRNDAGKFQSRLLQIDASYGAQTLKNINPDWLLGHTLIRDSFKLVEVTDVHMDDLNPLNLFIRFRSKKTYPYDLYFTHPERSSKFNSLIQASIQRRKHNQFLRPDEMGKIYMLCPVREPGALGFSQLRLLAVQESQILIFPHSDLSECPIFVMPLASTIISVMGDLRALFIFHFLDEKRFVVVEFLATEDLRNFFEHMMPLGSPGGPPNSSSSSSSSKPPESGKSKPALLEQHTRSFRNLRQPDGASSSSSVPHSSPALLKVASPSRGDEKSSESETPESFDPSVPSRPSVEVQTDESSFSQPKPATPPVAKPRDPSDIMSSLQKYIKTAQLAYSSNGNSVAATPRGVQRSADAPVSSSNAPSSPLSASLSSAPSGESSSPSPSIPSADVAISPLAFFASARSTSPSPTVDVAIDPQAVNRSSSASQIHSKSNSLAPSRKNSVPPSASPPSLSAVSSPLIASDAQPSISPPPNPVHPLASSPSLRGGPETLYAAALPSSPAPAPKLFIEKEYVCMFYTKKKLGKKLTNKAMFFNAERRAVCFRKLNEAEEQVLPINTITKITLGCNSDVFAKFKAETRGKENQCFSFHTAEKTFDVEMLSPEDAQQLHTDMTALLAKM